MRIEYMYTGMLLLAALAGSIIYSKRLLWRWPSSVLGIGRVSYMHFFAFILSLMLYWFYSLKDGMLISILLVPVLYVRDKLEIPKIGWLVANSVAIGFLYSWVLAFGFIWV